MKVWELIAALQKAPAGMEVGVCVNDGELFHELLRVDDDLPEAITLYIESETPDDE